MSNACSMFNIPLGPKLLKWFTNITRYIIYFYNFRNSHTWKISVITCLIAYPACAVVTRNSEYVLTTTRKYFNLSNSVTKGASICQKPLESRPWGFTPKIGIGKYCGHKSHCLTLWSAFSLLRGNCLLKLVWWWKTYDCWTSYIWDKASILVNLSEDSLPSASGQAKLVWAQNMVILFDKWHLKFTETIF